MSRKFNWRTEDEDCWGEKGHDESETAVPRQRQWLTFILIGAAILAAVALIYRQVNERLETTTANINSDILASHNLVQQAGRQNDADLFNSLISGRDSIWSDWQNQLVQRGWLFERAALGLQWQPSDKPASLTEGDTGNASVEIEVNPEFTAAEVRFSHSYQIEIGNGLTDTVALQQTAVYRRGSQRWLYSPPDDAFWGDTVKNQGTYLTLTYPQRDQETAERLALDLDAKLIEMCHTIEDIDCPDSLQVYLRLDSSSESLINVAVPIYVITSGFRLNLPTPTIVGLPVDEAGYQALYRGYAAQLLTAVISELVDYRCCDHVAFYQVLLDQQLDVLGIRPFPTDQVNYTRVVNEGIDFSHIGIAWRSDRIDYLNGAEGWLVYTAVDFIQQQLLPISNASLQKQMRNRRYITDWMMVAADEALPYVIDLPPPVKLNDDWLAFAREHVLANQEPPPIPLPEQDIYLLCSSLAENRQPGLYQYHLETAQWENKDDQFEAVLMGAFPQDDALIFLSFETADEEMKSTIWRDGASELFLPEGFFTLGQFDPTGQRLLAYDLTETGEALALHLVETDSCEEGSCASQTAAGIPIWSPDGNDIVWVPSEAINQTPFMVNGRINLFDVGVSPNEERVDWPIYYSHTDQAASPLSGFTVMGRGYAPFWLDGQTIGYISQDSVSSDADRRQILSISTSDESVQPILNENALIPALETKDRPTEMVIQYALVHPMRPELLFVIAFSDTRQFFIYSYNLETGDLRYHLQTGFNWNHSLGFSPDGRYLVLTGADPDAQSDSNHKIYLYDIANNEVEKFGGVAAVFTPSNNYDWSADGDWLVLNQSSRTLVLVAPNYDYQQIIPHGLSNCSNVAWLNR